MPIVSINDDAMTRRAPRQSEVAADAPLSYPQLIAVTGYPPTSVGGGNIWRNLLRDYPNDRLTIITSGPLLDHLRQQGAGAGLLAVEHVGMYPWRSRLRGARRLLRSLNVAQVLPVACAIARRASRHSVILTMPWGGEFGSELFVAAYLAHRRSGAKLVVYELDEWRAALASGAARITRLLERVCHGRILKAASAVWVISEPLAEEFRARYGVMTRVLPNCVELERFARARPATTRAAGEVRVLYTGSVFGAQADALRNVLAALPQRSNAVYTLVVHTPNTAEELVALGLSGRGLRVEPAVAVDEMPDLLASADILALPLSFDPQYGAMVKTSLPTKTADYLASGVPILIHAPPHASVTRLARAEGWAEIVDEPSVDHVRAALERLATDDALRRRLRENSLRIARLRHDLRARREEFITSIRQAALCT